VDRDEVARAGWVWRQQNEFGNVLHAEARMKRWIGVSSIVIGLVAASACNRGDADRARSESRDAQEKARQQLDEASRKLKQELKRADQQTREDLDKAREQVRQALRESERDAQKARDRLRDHPKDDDSHQ
jgi:type VI protein secretion system component VasK